MTSKDDTQKMLRVVINGQSAFRQEVLGKIDKLDQKLTRRIDGLDSKLDKAEKNLVQRIDKLGKQLAYLEDDAPTREEFDKLEERVDKIGSKTTSVI